MQNATPMLRQYLEIKQQYPGTLLFFRLGDFYEMFNDDAVTGSRELEITLASAQQSALQAQQDAQMAATEKLEAEQSAQAAEKAKADAAQDAQAIRRARQDAERESLAIQQLRQKVRI